MEEVEHVIEVLEKVRKAIKEEDVINLRDLSNQTIHTVSAHQDTGNGGSEDERRHRRPQDTGAALIARVSRDSRCP